MLYWRRQVKQTQQKALPQMKIRSILVAFVALVSLFLAAPAGATNRDCDSYKSDYTCETVPSSTTTTAKQTTTTAKVTTTTAPVTTTTAPAPATTTTVGNTTTTVAPQVAPVAQPVKYEPHYTG